MSKCRVDIYAARQIMHSETFGNACTAHHPRCTCAILPDKVDFLLCRVWVMQGTAVIGV